MEFLYTRQQMEGFKGYNHRVKIGNWSEDMELDAVSVIFELDLSLFESACVSL
jgi:hypothetical protein